MKKTSKRHLTKAAPSALAGVAMVAPATPVARSAKLSAIQALALPLCFTAILAGFTMLPRVQGNDRLYRSFVGAALFLLIWSAILFVSAMRSKRTFTLEIVLKKQHYLQACLQLVLILYWGWYWRQVYDSAYLIAAQLVFAYAFDILLSWSRRDAYSLGFGQFPVIFSITLFFWFKEDWFYFQFLLVAVGFAAKEMLHWNKDGRSTHIFNP